MTDAPPARFSSTLPITVYIRLAGEMGLDWQELDRGPGYFTIPEAHEVRIKIKSIDNEALGDLVRELQDLPVLRYLDLAENRNITNEGLERLKSLPQLTGLNLSSCSITNNGISALKDLPRLASLNLSYCNRLSDPALKTLEGMRHLSEVDLSGCLSITTAGLSRVRRRTLTIHR